MDRRLPSRLPLLLLVVLAPLLVAGPLVFVRNSGDRMWGALTIDPPSNTDALIIRQDDFLTWQSSAGVNVGRMRNGTMNGSRTIENADYWVGAAFRSTGAAAASLPTCNSGSAGLYEWDTTNSRGRLCDGSIWQFLTTSATSAARPAWFYMAHWYNSKTVARTANLKTDHVFSSSSSGRLACSTMVVGVGAGNVSVAVRKNGATHGSAYTWPCTTAVGSSSGGAISALTTTTGDEIGIYVDPTACSTFPELMCNLELREP